MGAIFSLPLGVALGEPIGMACGAQAANRRQGHAWLDVLTSSVFFVGGLAWIGDQHKHGGVPTAFWVVAPAAQLAGTVAVERLTATRGMQRDIKFLGLC